MCQPFYCLIAYNIAVQIFTVQLIVDTTMYQTIVEEINF